MSEPDWPQALCSDFHFVWLPEIGIMIIAVLQMKNGKQDQLSDLFKVIQLLERSLRLSPSFSDVQSSFPHFC